MVRAASPRLSLAHSLGLLACSTGTDDSRFTFSTAIMSGSGDGDAASGQCTSDCLIASCGDGHVYEGFEERDDGNAFDTDV